MEAYLAQSQELKETAQRSFISYLKSVYLMRNKKVFNVESIDFDEYAKSLGLVVTPRVRFLQRLKKKRELQRIANGEKVESDNNDDDDESEKEEKIVKKSVDLSALMADESDDDDDAGLMKIKRKDHDIEDNGDENASSDDEDVIEDLKAARKEKVITKAALAKKIIKKKIIPNTKIQFDEEGKAVINTAKQLQSELAKEYEESGEGGIDIEMAKKLLREEDKFDRQRFKEMVKSKHKENKKKLKKKKEQKDSEEEFDEGSGSDFESGDEPDISWLPDYDKINAGKTGENDDDDESENDDDDDDEDPIHRPPAKLYEKRKVVNSDSSSSDEEDEMPARKKPKRDIVSKLNLNDAEALAMSLLNSN
jgi:ATP-dependent RNA helicase DDX10/DBP4